MTGETRVGHEPRVLAEIGLLNICSRTASERAVNERKFPFLEFSLHHRRGFWAFMIASRLSRSLRPTRRLAVQNPVMTGRT
jgi:hypothetical protein